MDRFGWRGQQVRNVDGRTGVISIEDGFGPWLDLHIQCSDGTKATVTLNARGRDSGEAGWQWWCPDFGSHQAWLPLGEQGAPLEYAGESQDAKYKADDVVGPPSRGVRPHGWDGRKWREVKTAAPCRHCGATPIAARSASGWSLACPTDKAHGYLFEQCAGKVQAALGCVSCGLTWSEAAGPPGPVSLHAGIGHA